MNKNIRYESDSIGQLAVPADAYYGVQSLRGAQNFQITGHKLHPLFIKNMQNNALSIQEISRMVGYEDFSTFYRNFSRITGVPPSAYRSRVSDVEESL